MNVSRGVHAMNTTWYDKGIQIGFRIGFQIGLQIGIEKGRRNSLRELLEERFGTLSPAVLARLDGLPAEQLPALKAVLRANSLAELGLTD
jgi:hypothetical protein